MIQDNVLEPRSRIQYGMLLEWFVYLLAMAQGTPPDFSLWPAESVVFFIAQMNAPSSGHVTFHLPDGHVYAMAAEEGATLENLSQALDLLAAGSGDEFVNLAPNGQWYVFSSERFDSNCTGWPCLVLANADFSQGEAVTVDGQVIHPEGFSAITSDGKTIVFPGTDGPHALDLYRVTNDGSTWSQPVLLTQNSPFEWNQEPAISADGLTVLLSAGPNPYAQEGTGICRVNMDGSGFQTMLLPVDGPGGTGTNALKSPDFAPDGTVVFEADWNGEQVWRYHPDTHALSVVNSQFGNDNSPCTLPDGRIVSLWLEPSGLHEIKVMSYDGTSYFMLLSGWDVDDIGMGCGQ